MRNNLFIPFFLALFFHLVLFLLFSPPQPLSFLKVPSSDRSIGLRQFSLKNAPRKSSKSLPSEANSKNPISISTSTSVLPLSSGSLNLGKKGGSEKGSEKGPQFMSYQEPDYPPIARKKGLEGFVKIKVFFNNEGGVERIEIVESSGVKILDESVKKAALTWKIQNSNAFIFEKAFEFKLNTNNP